MEKLILEKAHVELKIEVMYRYVLTVAGYLLEYGADTFIFKLCQKSSQLIGC